MIEQAVNSAVVLTTRRRHRDLIIRYERFQPEVLEIIKREIGQVVWFIPPWVDVLVVELDQSNGSGFLATSFSPEYHRARFMVRREHFCAEDHHERIQSWLHEIGHLWMAQLHRYSETLLESACGDDRVPSSVRQAMVDQLEAAAEVCVDGLARFIDAEVQPLKVKEQPQSARSSA